MALRGARLGKRAGDWGAVSRGAGLSLWVLLGESRVLLPPAPPPVCDRRRGDAHWLEGCACCRTQGRSPRRELGFCRWARNCHRSLSTECARSWSLLLVGGSLASVSPIN